MKIPLHLAEKLLRISRGENIPSSLAKHSLIEELVLEGILERKGRIQKTLQLHNINSLQNYLQNKFSINDLSLYIEVCKKEEISRGELVAVSSNSKLFNVRTFKGFLVNCYDPVHTTLNGKEFKVNPVEGIFQFIYDFESFIPSSDITIVGIENPENFRHIEKQKYLFSDIKPLFVSRYPQNQSKDLIKWLKSIPNNYLHFGDFDLAGIGIYFNEFEKHLNGRTTFFIPENIESLIKKFGNKERYDNQKLKIDASSIREENLSKLINTIHKCRKGLDQEILIRE